MSSPKYEVWKPILALGDYLERVEAEKQKAVRAGNKADFVFRGQRVADWPLTPKVARVKWKGTPFKTERLILEEFGRTTPRFPYLDTDDDWDRMAVAQHHGLPTRLLDWTYSALAAVWFAVSKDPEKDDKGKLRDGVVWLLKPLATDFVQTPPVGTPFSQKRSMVFRPRVIAERIQAQAGIFVLHAAIKGRFIPLEVNSNFTSKLTQIPVPAARFVPLRHELHVCGVNHATMFPDLDGLCRHLTWRFTH